ncbi:MAG TPA: RNA methyltransferase [Chitinophagaceae bacterium]
MQSALPEKLIESLSNAPGFDRTAFEEVHATGRQVTSVRINPFKISSSELADEITSSTPIEITQVPWSSFGYYLSERPSFTLDPLLHAGCYYVQEASSMFLEQAIKQSADVSRPLKVLDLCAAPGGKSTLIQSLITPDSLLVSNEVIKTRTTILQENITKWGAANVVVTSNDPKDFSRLENFFDLIVIDAPCSGSGLFRRDPSAIEEWSESNVMLCSQRQQRIVSDALPALKKGGILIYCTCSYSVAEDESVVDWLCDEFSLQGLQLSIDPSWNIVESFSENKTPCYRFYPDKVKGEGFFLSCLQKPDGDLTTLHSGKSRTERLTKNELQVVLPWMGTDAGMFIFRHKEDVIAVPPSFESQIPLLQDRLYLRQAGINMGKLANNELIPHHALALSTLLNNSITKIPLDREQALQYLRKAEVLPVAGVKGWALIRYNGHNLGWVKVLSNRVNNYYPKEWRILKS